MTANPDPNPATELKTNGGAYVGGNVTTDLFVGRDYVVGYSAAEISALIAQLRSAEQPRVYDGRQPYVGLSAFTAAEAEFFFGREALVDELIQRVARVRFVCLAGPSGSGKSSLAQAGLLPALQQGRLPGSQRWRYALLRPDHNPIEQLALALARLAQSPEAATYLRQQGRRDPLALHTQAETLLSHQPEERLVVLVDQFEELFTQTSDWAERTAFLNLLTTAVQQPSGRVTVLLALRSDFLTHCADFPALRTLISQEFQLVGSLTPAELLRAVVLPALQVGIDLEPALAAQIVSDMAGEPGALPLLQFALHDLFDSYQPRRGVPIKLTLADYLARGGLHQALARHADRVFATLDETQKSLARQIFTRLITVGRGTVDTRRTATFAELTAAATPLAQVNALVNTLADARLVTTSAANGADASTVLLAHERLIDAWPWLHRLVNENRERIALQNQISDDAREWAQAGKEASYLYTGARLATVQEALQQAQLTLDAQADAYIQAAVAAASVAQQQRRRLWQGVFAALALAVLIFAGLAGWALIERGKATTEGNARATEVVQRATAQAGAEMQRDEANRQKEEAQRQTQIALVRQLAAQSDAALTDSYPRSLLLAVEAVQVAQRVTPTLPLAVADTALHARLEGQPNSILLTSHEDSVWSVAFSGDGKWLASGSNDKTVRVWAVGQWDTEPIVPRGQEGYIRSVAFSADSKWLASGGDDKTVRVWAVGQWDTEPVVLRGQEGSALSVAFSADGKWLASGGDDKTVRVWAVGQWDTEPVVLRGHGSYVYSVAFSRDGKWLASGSDDKTVRIWAAGQWSAKPVVLRGQENPVRSVAFSADGKWLASGSLDTTVRVWPVGQWDTEPGVLRGHEDAVFSVAFSGDGKWLASGSGDKTVRLWAVDQAEPVVLRGHEGSVMSVAFSADGKWLASGNWDKTVQVWAVEQWPAEPIMLRGHEGYVESIAFSEDSRWLASSSNDRTVRVWTMRQWSAKPVVLRGHEDYVWSVAFSRDNRWLASGSLDKTVRVWSVGQWGAEPQVLRGHEGSVYSVAFSTDNKWLASGGGDKTVRVWPVGQWGAEPLVLRGHEAYVHSVAFSRDSRWLASGSDDKTVRVWVVGQWDAEPVVLRGYEDSVLSVAFSEDGKWLAGSSRDKTVRVWVVGQWDAEPVVLRGHEEYVWSVAFSRDGKWLASGSLDNTLRVWVVGQWQAEPLVLRGQVANIGSVAFSRNSRWLASGTRDNALRLWTIPVVPLVELACRLSGRNFTQAEWQQYFGTTTYRVTCPQWRVHSSVVATLLEAGRSLVRDGDGAGATAKFELALQLEPDLKIEPEKEVKKVEAQGFIAQGQDLAESGDIIGAVVKFKQALQLDPSLNIEPEKEAKRVAAASLVDEGSTLAQGGDVTEAIVKFELALQLDSQLGIEPEKEAKKVAAMRLVDEGRTLAQDGDVAGATVKFELALQLDPQLGIEPQLLAQIEWGRGLASTNVYTQAMAAFATAQTISPTFDITASLGASEWNRICWRGALAAAADVVLPACERAVALAPDLGDIRDSRGLARALTGDVAGAIADFEFYVQWVKEIGLDSNIAWRENWIAELKAGKSPQEVFDAKTLEMIKNE